MKLCPQGGGRVLSGGSWSTMVLYDQVGCVCEISRGPRVPDQFWGNYPRVITQGFWGSEKVGGSDGKNDELPGKL